MVQDKTYFQSELRQKINMLTSEINKMSSEADIVNRENSNYATFEKRCALFGFVLCLCLNEILYSFGFLIF